MWPKIHPSFPFELRSKSVPRANFRVAAMIEPCCLVSIVQNTRRISLGMLDFWVVPFSKYAQWKHKVAQAATLWVKSHMRGSFG